MSEAMSDPNMPPEARRMIEMMTAGPVGIVISLFINLVVMSIFGTLGGLLGVAIFKKTPPPPPPGTVEVLPQV